MELKIISKKEEPLLSRTKVESEIVFDKATPPISEIKNKLASLLGKDEKLLVVKGVYTLYGLKKAKNLSYAYENEESLKKIEIEKKAGKKEEGPKKESEKKGKIKEVKAEEK